MSAVVGIDLGTTNTVVGVVQAGRAITVANERGERLIPSVVSFHPNGSVLIGRDAKDRRLVDAKNTVYSTKRLIGRSFDSDAVQKARSRAAFQIREGPGQGPLVVARSETYTLPEISAFVLREVKRIAEAALKESVDRAVITVPANFNDLQRAATKVAGRIAGVEVIRILNEPTAAALAYGYGKGNSERIAIYDFGGGTFDVTLLDLAGNVFEVLATAGDTFLGGDDIDHAIAERIAQEFLKKHRYDPHVDGQAFEHLLAAAERLKIQVASTGAVASHEFKDIAFGAGGKALDLTFSMSPQDLMQVAIPFVDRTLQVCKDALGVARLKENAFDQIILVGGSTRIPIVRDRVTQFFGRRPLDRLNPDEVVALGAAIQAAALTGADRRREADRQSSPPAAPGAARQSTSPGMPTGPRRGTNPGLGEAPRVAGPRAQPPPLPPPRRAMASQPDHPLFSEDDETQTGVNVPVTFRSDQEVDASDESTAIRGATPELLDAMQQAAAKMQAGDEAFGILPIDGLHSPPPAKALSTAVSPQGRPGGPPPLPPGFAVPPPPAFVPPAVSAPPPSADDVMRGLRETLLRSEKAGQAAQVAAAAAAAIAAPTGPRATLTAAVAPPSSPVVVPEPSPSAQSVRATMNASPAPAPQPPPVAAARATVGGSTTKGAPASPGAQSQRQQPAPPVQKKAPPAPIPKAPAPAPQPAAPPPLVIQEPAQKRPAAPLLIDVTPLSLSVETVGGYTDVIIERNTPVPCERTRLFATASDNQLMVRVNVAQGESVRFKENVHLGQLELSGLSAGLRGETKVAVTFELDTDGILGVRAVDKKTGKATSAKIKLGGGMPDAGEVAAMAERMQQRLGS